MGAVEVHSLGDYIVVFVSSDSVRVDAKSTSSFETEDDFQEELFFTSGKVLAMQIVLEHHQTPHKLVIYTIFLRSSNVKCSEYTLVPAAIVNSFPSSQQIALIHYFP